MIALRGGESRWAHAEGVKQQLGARLGLCWRARVKQLTRKQHPEFVLSCVMETSAVAVALRRRHPERVGKRRERDGQPRGLRGVLTTVIVFDSCHVVLGKKRSRNIAKRFYLQ